MRHPAAPILTLDFLRKCFPRQEPGVLEMIRQESFKITDPHHSNPNHPPPLYWGICHTYTSKFKSQPPIIPEGVYINYERHTVNLLRINNEYMDCIRFGHLRGREKDRPVIWKLWFRDLMDWDHAANWAISGYARAKHLMEDKINEWRLLLVAKKIRAQRRAAKRKYGIPYQERDAKKHVQVLLMTN